MPAVRWNARQCAQYTADTLFILTPLLLACGVVFYSYDLYSNGNKEHLVAWFSAGGFVLITFPLSLYLIIQHLVHWNMPKVQKYVVRIIWMVPIYSIESWCSLRFREFALYIETVRECYEAYVIYSFMYFLIALLGDEKSLLDILLKKPRERGNHFYPLNKIFSAWELGQNYMHHCKLGVFQYVIIKNITAAAIIVLHKHDLYGEGDFKLHRGYIYICVIDTMSQLWALYCLSMFYTTFSEELTPWRPVGKFLSVKLVIFFTWWQSILVNMAAAWDVLPDEYGGWTLEEINKGLQDYLICIEMFIAALAFHFTFSYKDFTKCRIKKRLPLNSNTGDNAVQLDRTSDSDGDEGEISSTERKPFLTALLQSSLPDDMVADFRKITTGQKLYRAVTHDIEMSPVMEGLLSNWTMLPVDDASVDGDLSIDRLCNNSVLHEFVSDATELGTRQIVAEDSDSCQDSDVFSSRSCSDEPSI